MLVSVVIPVKNGAPWLEQGLKAIFDQEGDFEKEVLILDSGSNDGTDEILKKFPVQIHSVAPGTYNHGATRNWGASLAKGEIVVMTVQDALPASKQWLQELVSGFVDQTVAGVCGLQVVPKRRDMNPVEWHLPRQSPGIRVVKHDINTPDIDLAPDCGWDNVTAAYRRDILLEKVPFRTIQFGEDAQWARDAIKCGYTIVYNLKAQVYHYHEEYFAFTYKRSIEELYMKYNVFGIVPEPLQLGWKRTLRQVIHIWKTGLPGREQWKWIKYNRAKDRAIQLAILDFLNALNNGKEKLDEFYRVTCNQSVIAKKISV